MEKYCKHILFLFLQTQNYLNSVQHELKQNFLASIVRQLMQDSDRLLTVEVAALKYWIWTLECITHFSWLQSYLYFSVTEL